MPGRLEFQFNFSAKTPQRPVSKQNQRILLLGNFSGTRTAERSLTQRQIHRIDIDNYDQVLAKIAPRVSLSEPACDIDITEYDDFHPDSLYRDLVPFTELRNLRKRLRDPASAADAMAEISGTAVTTPSEADSPPPPASDSLFEQLLGGSPPGAAPKHTQNASDRVIDGFIRNVIADHIVSTPDTSAYLNSLDLAQSDLMNAILHAPAMQSLEANWRGVWWLVSELSRESIDGGELSLHVLDVDRAEVSADLAAAGDDLSQSALYQNLTTRSGADAQPWSLILALYHWEATPTALAELAALSAIAKASGAALISEASPGFVGAEDFAVTSHPSDWDEVNTDFQQTWDAFRRHELAPWLGLALPRVLLRLPYGPDSDPIDSFEFTEQAALPEHGRFLWGNPALACGLAIGRQFLDQGEDFSARGQLDIDDMPAYSYKQDGEAQMQACAEAYLAEQAALRISQQGLIPLLSFRQRNAVRVGGLYSCSQDQRALAGVGVG